MNVLLVDDETMMRSMLRRILTARGYDVLDACSGAEALALIQENNYFDILITDVVMDGMDGRKLARQIREKTDVPVVFMSGFLMDEAERQHHGRCVFLSKPFSPNDIMRAIKQALALPVG